MRFVLTEPPARNTLTGGYLYNAQVVAAAPPGACELRVCSVADLQDTLDRPPRAGEVLVLDSLYLSQIDPRCWSAHCVVHLVHSLPAQASARVDQALAQARGCIATSAFMADRVKARAAAARTRVCHPGVVARPQLSETPGPVPTVLTVANFERRKGHLALLQALARVSDLPFAWDVIGDPDADPACAAEFSVALARAGLAERVRVRGVCSPRDVQRAMSAASLFALLSVDEPYGMVYAESIAHGTPVVAWRQGGVLEIVADGATGLLADAGDVDAAAEQLRRLLASSDARARMRRHCARAAATMPTWETCARGFVTACRDLLGVRT
ncbi:MAG: glycosyltransferase [Planctomycetota bacterium]